MDSLVFALLAFLVFGVAFIYSNLGLGGGLLHVPILLWLAVDSHNIAAPISLTFAAATGLPSFYNHWRRGLADVRLGSMLVAGAMAGTFFGVFFNLQSTRDQFTLFFVLILFVFGGKMLYDWYRHPDSNDGDDNSKLTKRRLTAASGGEVGAGFLSGALGVGGGIINVPILMYIVGRGARKAIGTSSMMVVPTALTGFAIYAFAEPSLSPQFWLIYTLFPLVLVGAFIGSSWGLRKLKTRTVTLVFILLLFVAAAKLIWDLLPH